MDKKVWVIVAWAIVCQWAHALPVPEEDDSLLGNRSETSESVRDSKNSKAMAPVSRLPTSPVDLLRPDKISFYTFDSNGQVILKRMTEKEIQSLIAAGGGQLPVAISEPQKITESTGTKISDVVQNVQKVLEGELSKPPQTMTAIPTIPGHVNSEWSSILPAILAGDSDSINPEPNPIGFFDEPEIPEEKPMIQVPVITIEEPIHQYDKPEEKPVFQILNTIPAEEVLKDKNQENYPGVESKQPVEEPERNETLSVVSETHSTSMKVSGQEEVKIHQETPVKPVEAAPLEEVKPTEASLAPVSATTLEVTTEEVRIDSSTATSTSTTLKPYLGNEMPPTAATLASEETPQKAQTEALPTELTDSITSMISQVSDAIPSIMMDEKSKVPEAGSSDSSLIDAEGTPEGTSPVTVVPTTERIVDEEIKGNVTAKEEATTQVLKVEDIKSKTEASAPITEAPELETEAPGSKVETTTLSADKSDSSEIKATTPKPEILTTVEVFPDALPSKPTEIEPKEELPVEVVTEKDLDITEKPILRINITEVKEDIKVSPQNVSGATESTMVRIKLTDPLNKIHETLESSPVQPSTPEVEPLMLPTTEMSANGIASGLIAGFDEPQKTEISMEMIQFDQLPMISVLKLENSTTQTPGSTSEKSTTAASTSTSAGPKVEPGPEAEEAGAPDSDAESKISELQIRKDQKKETSLEKTPTSPPEKETEKWTLISQTGPKPTKPESLAKTEAPKRPSSMQSNMPSKLEASLPPRSPDPPSQLIPLDHSKTTPGLDSSVLNLEPDVLYFSNLCNDLAFSFWSAINQGLSKSRSLAVSPFGMTSLLAMIFLGARGPTSNQMNDVLKLDDITTFNPHLIFQNVTDSVASRRNQGIANAVFVRELFADKLKVNKLMTFYKEQAQKFYDGIVAEVNFSFVSNAVKRRTNLLIRKQTGGRIREFVKDNNLVPLRSPLAAVSANVFQTDCSSGNATSEGRDGELYFAVAPTMKLRKLVPVPATLWKAGVLAGYETSLDATAIALGGLDKTVSVIFVIPGSQGGIAAGDNLEKLEARIVNGALHDGAWNKLLKVIIPRPGLELQVPKFSHKSIINSTAALKNMGLEDIFEKHANLRGINDVGKDLHLADVFQMNLFSTCGDENFLAGKHHEEVYPASPQRNARSEETSEEKTPTTDQGKADNSYETEAERIARFTRQVDNEKPRLKLDRPFLYFVRHNPTGLILYMGRFNPRLLS